MDIKVKDKKFGTKLYDKRVDFSFNVISMPNLKSNIPLIQTYGVFYSQLFRLCYVNSCLEGFVSDVKLLITKLSKQNFDKYTLLSFLKKFIRNNHPCVFKFWSKLKVEMFT